MRIGREVLLRGEGAVAGGEGEDLGMWCPSYCTVERPARLWMSQCRREDQAPWKCGRKLEKFKSGTRCDRRREGDFWRRLLDSPLSDMRAVVEKSFCGGRMTGMRRGPLLWASATWNKMVGPCGNRPPECKTLTDFAPIVSLALL